jgi:cell division transport system permease protein
MKPHLKTTWTHIRRSPYQALSAVAIMFLTFFLATTMVLVAAGSQKILHYFETRPQATAFFKDEMSAEQVEALKGKLLETGKVKEMKYVSKEEALEIYRNQNKDDPLLLEMVTANILPASLEVSPSEIEALKEIAEILKSEEGVEEVVFQEEVIKALTSWTKNLRSAGLILIGFLGIISFLIILIIIGMKVALKKEEIEILNLIGGTRGYIRLPFIFEGIFYGVVGAVIGWGTAFLILLYATPALVKILSGIPLLPVPPIFILSLLGAEIIGGMIIGTLGSLLAVKKYLK